MRSLAIVTAGALGVWLGIHAIRAFLAALVWNVAEDAPAIQMALFGLAIWLVGLSGWLPARLIGFGRAAIVLGVAFAAIVVARQAINDEVLTALFAIGAVVVWLWWLPAFLELITRRDGAHLLAPALILGLSAQVGGQLALGGLDLHMMINPLGALLAIALAALLVAALAATYRAPADEPRLGRWGPAVILPWLFLQLTLLAGLGRIEALGGWELPMAGLVVGAGLIAAAIALRWSLGWTARVVVGLATVALVLLATLGGLAALAVIPAQAGLGFLLAAALAPPTRESPRRPRVYAIAALGGAAYFILLFALYYDFADTMGVVVWPAAALIVALPVLRGSAPQLRSIHVPAAAAALGLAGVLVATLTGLQTGGDGPAPRDLVLVNYNIHQGIARNGVPNLARTADVIADERPDIVTLQEVNRVSDLSGGVDSFSWLQRRFADYTAVFGAMHGVHFGNAIMSRHRVIESGNEHFILGPGDAPRAFVWAILDTAAGPLLVVSSHLTPYGRTGTEEAKREAQAARLLAFWQERGRPMAIFAGDYNAPPEMPAIALTVAGGLVDARAKLGIGDEWTFHSTGNLFDAPSSENLDYIFTAPAIELLTGRIVQTDASDHMPLVMTLRLP